VYIIHQKLMAMASMDAKDVEQSLADTIHRNMELEVYSILFLPSFIPSIPLSFLPSFLPYWPSFLSVLPMHPSNLPSYPSFKSAFLSILQTLMPSIVSTFHPSFKPSNLQRIYPLVIL
jgi:hypothetical protein